MSGIPTMRGKHQQVAGEHRFIDCYENSGESLDHYGQYLLAHGYAYGGLHFLLHDAENRSLQAGKSARELLQTLLPGHCFEVMPRVERVITGIQQTRMALGDNVFIDARACADGIAALDNYRKKYNEKLDAYTDEPVHDRYSNYADTIRQWAQGFRQMVVDAGFRGRRAQGGAEWAIGGGQLPCDARNKEK